MALKSHIISYNSLKVLYVTITSKKLAIEGLKVEKRLIQSTDRKLLDVTRQSKIDEEISSLEK